MFHHPYLVLSPVPMAYAYSAWLSCSYPQRPHFYSSICNLLTFFSKCCTDHPVLNNEGGPPRSLTRKTFLHQLLGVPCVSALSVTSWIASTAESHFAQGHAQRGGEWCTCNNWWRPYKGSDFSVRYSVTQMGHLHTSSPMGLAEAIKVWLLLLPHSASLSCLPQVFIPRVLPSKYPAHESLSQSQLFRGPNLCHTKLSRV